LAILEQLWEVYGRQLRKCDSSIVCHREASDESITISTGPVSCGMLSRIDLSAKSNSKGKQSSNSAGFGNGLLLYGSSDATGVV
jgi:hypothetical protein